MNTISPGPVDTPLFREGKPQNVIDSIAKQNPSRRLGEPDDIAPVVGFLASQAAQWVTGQNIRVNGVSASAVLLYMKAVIDELTISNNLGLCCVISQTSERITIRSKLPLCPVVPL